jgi:hypothetical protein
MTTNAGNSSNYNGVEPLGPPGPPGDRQQRRRGLARTDIATETLRELSQRDLSLDDIAQEIGRITGKPAPTRSTVSKWLSAMNARRYLSHADLFPWKNYDRGSRWRRMLEAIGRMREVGFNNCSSQDQRWIDMLFDYINPGYGRARMVVGWHDEIGWYLADATQIEIECGEIIRRPTIQESGAIG